MRIPPAPFLVTPCQTIAMLSLHILVVEDNPHLQPLICEMLAIIGHHATSATSAEQALELFGGKRFDILLADINLPGMSGIELAKIVKEAEPGIRIIFASGFGYLVADKLHFGFTLLHKPYNVAQLRSAVEDCMLLPVTGATDVEAG
jgi:CheY-like chemotaxis protein